MILLILKILGLCVAVVSLGLFLLLVYDCIFPPPSLKFYTGRHKGDAIAARFLFFLGRISIFFGQHRIEVKQVPLYFKNLPNNLNKMKIVQISDIHYLRDSFNVNLLGKAVKIINEQKPDILLVTGDILQEFNKFYSSKCAEKISEIKCNEKYGCLGAHDTEIPHSITKQVVIRVFEKKGLKILDNEVIHSERFSNLRIMGCGSYLLHDCKPESLKWHEDEKTKEIDKDDDEEIFSIMMSHNPDSLRLIMKDEVLRKWENIGLVCGGHTHGGQICFPFTKTPVLYYLFKLAYWCGGMHKNIRMVSRIVKDWDKSQGLISLNEKEKKERYLYVNRGLGSHCNLRFFCRPEITVFQLFQQKKN